MKEEIAIDDKSYSNSP